MLKVPICVVEQEEMNALYKLGGGDDPGQLSYMREFTELLSAYDGGDGMLSARM